MRRQINAICTIYFYSGGRARETLFLQLFSARRRCTWNINFCSWMLSKCLRENRVSFFSSSRERLFEASAATLSRNGRHISNSIWIVTGVSNSARNNLDIYYSLYFDTNLAIYCKSYIYYVKLTCVKISRRYAYTFTTYIIFYIIQGDP